ncbi:MAG: hypothetical protein M5U18_00865 [Dehalococcoidia bacterium]|nr:hypothetical protein [Dehalococcoidia bacterium]
MVTVVIPHSSTREKAEMVQAKQAATARDLAAQPAPDYIAQLVQFQRELGRASDLRGSGYEQLKRVKEAAKRSSGWTFDLRSYRSMAEADIKLAESRIREIKAEQERIRPLADKQRKESHDRAERMAKFEAAEKKLRGLGLDSK